jgi:hypothetical protein
MLTQAQQPVQPVPISVFGVTGGEESCALKQLLVEQPSCLRAGPNEGAHAVFCAHMI